MLAATKLTAHRPPAGFLASSRQPLVSLGTPEMHVQSAANAATNEAEKVEDMQWKSPAALYKKKSAFRFLTYSKRSLGSSMIIIHQTLRLLLAPWLTPSLNCSDIESD
jgi:hypothetical protein